jgi:hypothetical protein
MIRPEMIRLRCLEAALEYSGGPMEALAMADMFAAYVNGLLDIEEIDITDDEADALDEREEGQFNEH